MSDGPHDTQLNPRTLRFVTSVQAALDARGLLGARLKRIDVIVDVAALVLGLLAAAGGYPLGLLIAFGAAMFLVGTRFQPLQRWLIARNSRSLLGRTIDISVETDGLRSTGELGTSFFPWSTLTAVRSDARTVIFMRDRVLLAYVPASSFSSPAHQAEIIRYARERIAGESQVTRG